MLICFSLANEIFSSVDIFSSTSRESFNFNDTLNFHIFKLKFFFLIMRVFLFIFYYFFACVDEWASRDWRSAVWCPVDGRGTRCGHRIRKQRLRRRRRRPTAATDRRGRAVDGRGRRGHRAAGRAADAGRRGGPPVPGHGRHQATTTVRAGAGARAVPPVAQPIPVVAAARTVHDNAVQGAQPAGVHQRRRRQARDTVADVGTAAAHSVGPVAGLQHARGHLRTVRRLLAGRQRVFLRQTPQVVQLGNYVFARIHTVAVMSFQIMRGGGFVEGEVWWRFWRRFEF